MFILYISLYLNIWWYLNVSYLIVKIAVKICSLYKFIYKSLEVSKCFLTTVKIHFTTIQAFVYVDLISR